jgi:hypothetical protein
MFLKYFSELDPKSALFAATHKEVPATSLGTHLRIHLLKLPYKLVTQYLIFFYLSVLQQTRGSSRTLMKISETSSSQGTLHINTERCI